MVLETTQLDVAGDVRLFVRSNRLAGEPPTPTVVCVHGLGEHGGRYEHFAEWLDERGWRVVLVDLRGHGQSTGPRTHVMSFDEYCTDVATVWRHFQLDRSPTVLLGHSMGGLIAIRSVQKDCVHPAALVLTSPLLGLKLRISPLKRLLGRLLVRILPRTRFRNGLDADNMTHDEKFAEERRNDPLIIRSVTAGWFFAMQRALVMAHHEAPRIQIPVLAFRGLADETTDGDALSTWLTLTRSPSHELISLPTHVHEIFHESDWRESLDRTMQWLGQIGFVIPADRIENPLQNRSCTNAAGLSDAGGVERAAGVSAKASPGAHPSP